MSDTSSVMQHVTLLHKLIVSQHKNNRETTGIQRLDLIMTQLKTLGIIEGIEVGGQKGRYFLIDGTSWVNTCRTLTNLQAPNFVMWEESSFFALMEQLVIAPDKSRVNNSVRKHTVRL